MAGGLAVTKEPATDPFAARFNEAGLTVLAFDFRRLGESGGDPRQIVRIGGHVFQVFVTNSAGILEPQYFMKSTEDYSTSGMRIGFNIMRVFSVGGKKGSW